MAIVLEEPFTILHRPSENSKSKDGVGWSRWITTRFDLNVDAEAHRNSFWIHSDIVLSAALVQQRLQLNYSNTSRSN